MNPGMTAETDAAGGRTQAPATRVKLRLWAALQELERLAAAEQRAVRQWLAGKLALSAGERRVRK